MKKKQPLLNKIFIAILLPILIYGSSIDLGFKSYHFAREYGYNENNIGLIIDIGDKDRYSIGYINKNSYNNKSYLAKLNSSYSKAYFGSYRFSFGLMSGYKKHNKKNISEDSEGVTYVTSDTMSINGILPFFSLEYKYNNFKISYMGALVYLGATFDF